MATSEMTIEKAKALCGGFRSAAFLESPKTGENVANQIEITCENGKIFQSYETVICVKTGGETYLREYRDTPQASETAYSTTTSKYLGVFLCEDSKTIKSKIKKGEYKVIRATDDKGRF